MSIQAHIVHPAGSDVRASLPSTPGLAGGYHP